MMMVKMKEINRKEKVTQRNPLGVELMVNGICSRVMNSPVPSLEG